MTKNFVLLTIDSLRADHATPDAGLMPVLNEHAESGARFSRAYANGYSTPISFPTLLTGTYADHYGGHGYMSEERPFLASLFQEQSFETAAFHSNPHLRKEKNYHTGFDVYNDFDTETGLLSQLRYLITQNLDSNSLPYKFLKRAYHSFRTVSDTKDYASAPTLNQRALDWYDERDEEKPFFLWVHYMDVHYPFYPPDETLAGVTDRTISNSRAIAVNGKMHEDDKELTDEDVADLEALYRGEVRYIDHHIGNLLDELDARGHESDTMYMVTSDHGELFGEHGLFGHPQSGYDESFHVPLVTWGPGIEEGETVEELTSLLDIPPTVADLFDFEKQSKWEGESMARYVQAEPVGRAEDAADSTVGDKRVIMGDEEVLACQTPSWRLVWWRDCPHDSQLDEEWTLWDVDKDERVPISDHEDVVADLEAELREFIDRAETAGELEVPDVDAETEQRLEALGYR
jgi:arylsulfatase A-like enzyme